MLKDIIQNLIPTMSKSQRLLADYFMGHYSDISFMTLLEVSRETEISEATIVRFCRTLGYSGFAELREAIQEEVKVAITPTVKIQETVEKIQNSEDLCTNLLNIDRSMLGRVEENISENRFQAAAAAIDEGGRIYLAAIGISRAVAAFLEIRLLRMKYDVVTIYEGGDEVINKLLGASPDDIFFGIGFIRPRRELLAGVKIATRKNMTRIIMTNSETRVLTREADILLEANRGPAEIMTSLAVPMALANMLTMELALRNRDRTVKAFDELDMLKKEFDL